MKLPPPVFRRLAATVLVALSIMSGCSSGDNDRLTQGPTASTRAASPGGSNGEDLGDDFDTDEPEFDGALRSFYDEFNIASDLHRFPDESVAKYGSGLADLASPSVVAQFDAWRATNEAHGDVERVLGISSVANIVDIDVAGPRVTIRDCTKETRQTRSGVDVTNYVTRVATVANEGGLYRVVDLDVEHQGDIFTAGYGCIPNTMATEATATTKTVVEGFLAAQADPRKGLPAAVDALVVDKLEAEMKSSLAEQAAKNFSTTSRSDMALSVLGIDARGLGLVAVVAACITYPEGLVLRELSSAKVMREVFPAGTASKVVYAVRFPETGDPVAYATVSEELSTKC